MPNFNVNINSIKSGATYRLAVIMFTDIVGYTALMDEDEDKAYTVLRKNLDIHRNKVDKYQGQWIKEIGDGILITFDTISDAVHCAISIMSEANKVQDLGLRIGLHQGEILYKDGDILGSEVNIASRIQHICPPDGILISESVYRNIANKKHIKTAFWAEKQLRHVNEPLKLYIIHVEGVSTDLPLQSKGLLSKTIKNKILRWMGILLPILLFLLGYMFYDNLSKSSNDTGVTSSMDISKSIAVLPFKYLNNNPDTDFLVEGFWEMLNTNLGRISELRVIPTLSMEMFRESIPDPEQIVKDLNVKYIIQTTVQQFDNSFTMIVSLNDLLENKQVWGNTYDNKWENTQQLQSELSMNIAQQILGTINQEEVRQINTAHGTDPIAYDLLLKGNDYYKKGDVETAEEMYEKAIEVDSTYAMAWYKLGWMRSWYVINGIRGKWNDEQKRIAKEAFDKALALQPDLLESQLGQAIYYYRCEMDYNKSQEIVKSLLDKYPNNVELKVWLGASFRRLGKLESTEQVWEELIIKEPGSYRYWNNYSQILGALGKYEDAEAAIKKLIELRPSNDWNYQRLAMIQIHADGGNTQRARKTLDIPFFKNRVTEASINIELIDRNYTEAIHYAKQFLSGRIQDHNLAITYYAAGNDSSRLYFQRRVDTLTNLIRKDQDENQLEDERVYYGLGIAYAGLGQKEKAVEAGLKAVELFNYSMDAFHGGATEKALMEIYIMIGEYDKALNLIRTFLDRPGGINTLNELKWDPTYDPIRGIPEFQALIRDP